MFPGGGSELLCGMWTRKDEEEELASGLSGWKLSGALGNVIRCSGFKSNSWRRTFLRFLFEDEKMTACFCADGTDPGEWGKRIMWQREQRVPQQCPVSLRR